MQSSSYQRCATVHAQPQSATWAAVSAHSADPCPAEVWASSRRFGRMAFTNRDSGRVPAVHSRGRRGSSSAPSSGDHAGAHAHACTDDHRLWCPSPQGHRALLRETGSALEKCCKQFVCVAGIIKQPTSEQAGAAADATGCCGSAGGRHSCTAQPSCHLRQRIEVSHGAFHHPQCMSCLLLVSICISPSSLLSLSCWASACELVTPSMMQCIFNMMRETRGMKIALLRDCMVFKVA